MNTTLTVALTHEIASYGAGVPDLVQLARRIFEHTAPGGVWVCSDVLGPDDGDRLVHLRLDAATSPSPAATSYEAVDYSGWSAPDVAAHVAALSPADRLRQFSRDFPELSGGRCDVRWLGEDEQAQAGDRTSGPTSGPTSATTEIAELTLRAAMEFLYTRDYTENYLSECHERFCDMTYAGWVDLLTAAGFTLEVGSGPWRNDWLVENRLSIGAALTDAATGTDVPWPDTHVLFVARRPAVAP